MTIANYLENELLDAVFNADAFSVATVYVKLHVGDPGEAGTSNAAAETTRKSSSWGAASGGAVANDAAISWTAYPGAESVTHISLWDHATAGNCLWAGPLGATKVMQIGDTLQFDIGEIDVTLD